MKATYDFIGCSANISSGRAAMTDDVSGPAGSDRRPARRRTSSRRGGGDGRLELPADAPAPPGSDFFVPLVRRRGDVTDLVTHLLGRPVRARLLGEQVIRRVRSPGLVRLRTTGPFLHRHVRLDDSLPPHLPVAVLWMLIVPWRLPAAARLALVGGAEPLDRLMTRHGVHWSAEALETQVHTVAEASTDFPWAAPGTPLVEQGRLLVSADTGPVATTIDEIPLLRAGADPTAPLRRRPAPSTGSPRTH
jgi:hypothetical protein